MNRTNFSVVVYLLLVLLAGILIAEYLTATRDSSWIVEVENFIKEENWVPDSEFIPLMLTSFFIYENGTEQYIYLYSQNELAYYTYSLINQLNRQIKESISEDTLTKILENGRVLLLSLRFYGEKGIPRVKYFSAYFVLEDNQGTGLDGTIILQEKNSINSVWQITKSSIW